MSTAISTTLRWNSLGASALAALSVAWAAGTPLRAQWIPSNDPDPAAAPETTLSLQTFGLPADTPGFILMQFPQGLTVKVVQAASSPGFTSQLDLGSAGVAFPWLVSVPFGSVVNAGDTGFGDVVTTGSQQSVFQIGGGLVASLAGGSGLFDHGIASRWRS